MLALAKCKILIINIFKSRAHFKAYSLLCWKMRELPVKLSCPFPCFCQPASYHAPIPTVSLPSLAPALIHLVFSTYNAVLQDSFATFSMTRPISLSLAFSVFSATAGRLIDVRSKFTWLGPIPACDIPISGQQFCRLQEIFTQFKTGFIFRRLKITVTHRQRVSCLCRTLVFLV